MIPRLSDDEVIAITMREAQKKGVYEYNVARAVEDIYIPQLEKMQEEIATLKKLNGLDDADLRVFFENVNLKHDLEQFTAKHEKLVKGLKELTVTISFDEKGRFGEEWDSIKCSEITKLLTESEGE